MKEPREEEVDLLEAMDMLDVPEEVLGKMAAEGKQIAARQRNCLLFIGRDRAAHRSPDCGSPITR